MNGLVGWIVLIVAIVIVVIIIWVIHTVNKFKRLDIRIAIELNEDMTGGATRLQYRSDRI